jgi:hypothetical protein
MRQPASNVTREKLEQSQKHPAESVSSDEGMQIHRSDSQAEKAHRPIVEIPEPDSKATFEREVHPQKQDSSIVSSDEEIQID